MPKTCRSVTPAATDAPPPSPELSLPYPTVSVQSAIVAGRTQEALYERIDLELSWSEDELPQLRRTKHVHGLHPYLGKFIPQLVETFLQRYFRRGECIFDPFVGSGTTLVEANAFGADSVGVDISAFNCLVCEVKTRPHSLASLELSLEAAAAEARGARASVGAAGSAWLADWFAPPALAELLAYRAVAERLPRAFVPVAQLVLSRAARSARMTTHFDLEFPRAPVRSPYFCQKHKRICRPVEEAGKFLHRYTQDTVQRLRDFSLVRTDRRVSILHADARSVELPVAATGIITSPPYPGLIDYHEQHRYAYELLDLRDLRACEIGAGARGRGRAALDDYVEAMVQVFRNAARQLPRGAPVIVVVHDSRGLYPEILRRSRLVLEDRLTRHVNRRTGRRAGEFFEDVLVCSTAAGRPLRRGR